MLNSDRRKLQAGHLEMPRVEGEEAPRAVQRLREAGFTGSIEVVVLTGRDAVMGMPAGRVTLAYSKYGRRAVPPDAAITISVNPGAPEPLTEQHRARLAGAVERDKRAADVQMEVFRRLPMVQPTATQNRPPASVVLDPDMLERFDHALQATGALIADAWAPGLTDDQIDELLLPAGIDLPEEARMWWRRHNGTRAESPMVARHLAHRVPLGLEDVVDMFEHERAMMLELHDRDGLLQPITDKPAIFFGCTGPRDEPVPIYVQDDIDEPEAFMGSIGELICGWQQLLDRGAWIVKPDGTMTVVRERVPPTLERIA
jgi:hypothetical protein